MNRFPRKRVLAAIGFVGVLAVTGIAVAYFTSNGSGTGTASVGTSSAIVLHGTTSGSLLPGTTVPVSFTADNSSGGNEQVGTIHLTSIVACSVAFTGSTCPGSNEVTGCESINSGTGADANTNNFYMADVTENQDVSGGTSGVALTTSGVLKMNDLSSSQDACKNVNLLLNLTS